MRYWEITTIDQDVYNIGTTEYNENMDTFLMNNPTFYIDYGEGGSPENDYPSLCETTESEESATGDFSDDGELPSYLTGGVHAPQRPR